MRRFWQAQVRDLRVLLGRFGYSLLGFAALICAGGWVLLHYYEPLEGHPRLDYGSACYAIFTLIFFEPVIPFPTAQHPYVRALFFLVPLAGLGFIAEGLARFGVLVFNKQIRGEQWQTVMASTYNDHIIVCGLGHVGFRVAQELVKLDEDFVCIAFESKNVEPLRRLEIPVLVGDSRDEGLLEAANVRKARAIILATDDDLANLETAITARSKNSRIRLLVRLFDEGLAQKVQSSLGIHLAFSTSQLAAPAITLAALDKSVLHSFYVGEELMNVAEVSVAQGSSYVGKDLESLEQANQITVVVHGRGTTVQSHPPADIVLEAGDHLLLLCSVKTLGELEKTGLAPCSPAIASARRQ